MAKPVLQMQRCVITNLTQLYKTEFCEEKIKKAVEY